MVKVGATFLVQSIPMDYFFNIYDIIESEEELNLQNAVQLMLFFLKDLNRVTQKTIRHGVKFLN